MAEQEGGGGDAQRARRLGEGCSCRFQRLDNGSLRFTPTVLRCLVDGRARGSQHRESSRLARGSSGRRDARSIHRVIHLHRAQLLQQQRRERIGPLRRRYSRRLRHSPLRHRASRRVRAGRGSGEQRHGVSRQRSDGGRVSLALRRGQWGNCRQKSNNKASRVSDRDQIARFTGLACMRCRERGCAYR